MNYEEFFIDTNYLPKPLTKEELYSYLEQYKQGDKNAREQVIIHNIRLVLHRVSQKFSDTTFDRKDLVSVGIVGLMKSVDSFDTNKNFEFATYATRCIDNEILMFLRKGKKVANEQSIYAPIAIDKNGNKQTLEDILEDTTSDFISDYEDKITYDEIRKIVYNLSDRDKKIILLHFGFIDNHPYTQKEIAVKLKLSRSYISRLVNKIVRTIGEKLQCDDVISIFELEESKTTEIEGKGKKMKGKRLQTIYEYLKNYPKEEIDTIINKLSKEEQDLIKLRYGEDLDNPVKSPTWGKEQNDKFYGSLIPKMKRLLSNPEGKRKKTQTKQKLKKQINAVSSSEKEKNKLITQQLSMPEKQYKEQSYPTLSSEIEKEDCIRILELMKTPNFEDMLKSLTPKEAVIICLKLGYVDGKYFTTESIAEFLGIKQEEITEITKKVLLLYKESINQFIDKAVTEATNKSFVFKKKEN